MLHKAWRGWLLVQLGFQKKKNILTRAVNKLRRRKLTLAFNAWYDMHTRTKKRRAHGRRAEDEAGGGRRHAEADLPGVAREGGGLAQASAHGQ